MLKMYPMLNSCYCDWYCNDQLKASGTRSRKKWDSIRLHTMNRQCYRLMLGLLHPRHTFFCARSGSSSFTAVLSSCSSRPFIVMVKFNSDTFTCRNSEWGGGLLRFLGAAWSYRGLLHLCYAARTSYNFHGLYAAFCALSGLPTLSS